MANKILITYASKAGSTSEVADFIGKTLTEKGVTVDVVAINKVNDISEYKAVIIGSAIRAGKVLSESLNFVKKHKLELSKVPTAYFVVCMTLKDENEKNINTVSAYLNPLKAEVSPIDFGLFAGKMDYSKLDFISKFMVKNIVKVPEGDFRDWDAIKNWTNNFYTKIQ